MDTADRTNPILELLNKGITPGGEEVTVSKEEVKLEAIKVEVEEKRESIVVNNPMKKKTANCACCSIF